MPREAPSWAYPSSIADYLQAKMGRREFGRLLDQMLAKAK